MANDTYQKYTGIGWQQFVTPLSAKNFKTMDDAIIELSDIMSSFARGANYNQVLVVNSGESKPRWVNFVSFMAQYEYTGELE